LLMMLLLLILVLILMPMMIDLTRMLLLNAYKVVAYVPTDDDDAEKKY